MVILIERLFDNLHEMCEWLQAFCDQSIIIISKVKILSKKVVLEVFFWCLKIESPLPLCFSAFGTLKGLQPFIRVKTIKFIIKRKGSNYGTNQKSKQQYFRECYFK